MKKIFSFLLIAGTAFSGCSKHDATTAAADQQTTAAPLSSAFTIVDQAYVKEGTEAHFTNSSVSAVSYKWDFGTGDVSAEKEPSYTFPGCGPRTVTLITTDAAGHQATSSVAFEVLCTGKHAQHP